MSRDGWTYIVIAPEVVKVKIGKANHVSNRITTGKTFCPCSIECIATIKDSKHEPVLHRLMNDYHCDDSAGSEWFYLNNDSARIIHDYILNILELHPVMGSPEYRSSFVSLDPINGTRSVNLGSSFYINILRRIGERVVFGIDIASALRLKRMSRDLVISHLHDLVYNYLLSNTHKVESNSISDGIGDLLMSTGATPQLVASSSNRSWTEKTVCCFLEKAARLSTDSDIWSNYMEWQYQNGHRRWAKTQYITDLCYIILKDYSFMHKEKAA